MEVLIIAIYYTPIISSLSTMMHEVGCYLKEKGHSVTVMTIMPQHNLSKDIDTSKFCEYKNEGGINVYRVCVPRLKPNLYFLRGISQILLPFFIYFKKRNIIKKHYDSIFVSTPPLTLTILGNIVKKTSGAKYLLHVQDIFPQNAIDLGVMKNNYIIKIFEFIEKIAYKNADYISSHTLGSRKYLIEKKKITSEKIKFIPNWIDIKLYKKNKIRQNKYRKMYKIENNFVFLFAGVIGPAQGMDVIIDVANRIKEKIVDIIFLILCNKSKEKDRLAEIVKTKKINNVIFKPFISMDEYPMLLNEVDVGIVCLSSKNKTPVVPGKILGYMASSLPVVGILNKESDGHFIIKKSGCGYSAISDDTNGAYEIIKTMYREKSRLKQFGNNGFEYVQKNYSKISCLQKIEELLIYD